MRNKSLYRNRQSKKIFWEKTFPLTVAIYLVVALVIMLFATHAFSQTYANAGAALEISLIKANNSISLSADSSAEFLSFTGRNVEGKTYLKWLVKNEKSDGYYFIFRSVKKDSFNLIGSKQGVGVNIEKGISYWFTDSVPLKDNATYKIIFIGNNNKFLSSKEISISRP